MSESENTGELAAIADRNAGQAFKDTWRFQMKIAAAIIAFNAIVLGWNIKESFHVRWLRQQLQDEREAVPTIKLELGPLERQTDDEKTDLQV